MTKNYKTDLQDALRTLLGLTQQRDELETSIAKQKKRVAALYELVETDEGSQALSGLIEGISDACRVVLKAAEKALTPAEVRDRVQALGLPQQANLLASVHTTLKRLRDAGEVKETGVPSQTGGTAQVYTWVKSALRMADLLSKTPVTGGFDWAAALLSKNAVSEQPISKALSRPKRFARRIRQIPDPPKP